MGRGMGGWGLVSPPHLLVSTHGRARMAEAVRQVVEREGWYWRPSGLICCSFPTSSLRYKEAESGGTQWLDSAEVVAGTCDGGGSEDGHCGFSGGATTYRVHDVGSATGDEAWHDTRVHERWR
jgi:hypothetical protein